MDPTIARHPFRRRQLGKPDAGCLGAGLGSVAERHGSDPVHLLPAGWRPRVQAGHRRDHLRSGASGHVHSGRGQRLRPGLEPTARWARPPTATCSTRTKWSSPLTTSNTPTWTSCSHCFEQYEKEAQQLLALEDPLPLPAYERILEAAHSFNLLDARKAISVTERQRYILRIRTLTKAVAEAYYASREALGFPMCNNR